MHSKLIFGAMVLGLTLAAGCEGRRFTETVVNPFNLELPFLPHREPIRIGIIDQKTGILDPARWDIAEVGAPWTPLRREMQHDLSCPVQMEQLKPFQIAAHLESGRIDFAFLDAKDYLDMTKEFGERGEIIALSDVEVRKGLIVANARSDIESIDDIKGKRFSFGPKEDPVLDLGAKQALEAAGLSLDDIAKELLPIPNTFQHHISSRESAYEIAYVIGTDVGVIESSEYESWPDTGGSFLLRTFGKDNFRVLGETAEYRVDTIAEGPFIASAAADPAIVAQMRDFLISAGKDHDSAMRTLGLSAFHSPPKDVDEEIQRLASAESSPATR